MLTRDEVIQWYEAGLCEPTPTSLQHCTKEDLAFELIHTILHRAVYNLDVKRRYGGLDPPVLDKTRLKQLLDHGADPNYFNDQLDPYKIPLYHLVEDCDLDSIRLLVEYGADLAVRWTRSWPMWRSNLLGLACKTNRNRLEVAHYLALSGVPLPDDTWERDGVFLDIIVFGDIQLLEILRKRDSHFDNSITTMSSPWLDYATTDDMIRFLIENNAHLNSEFIQSLIIRRRCEILKLIFTKRLDVNSYRHQCVWSNQYRYSMVYGALCDRRPEVALVFLECGANPNGGQYDGTVGPNVNNLPLSFPLLCITQILSKQSAQYAPDYVAVIYRLGQLDATFTLVSQTYFTLYYGCADLTVYYALLQNGAVMTKFDTILVHLERDGNKDLATPARRMREWLKTGDVYHALCYLANRHLYPPYVRCAVPELDTRVGLDQEQDPFLFVPDGVDTMMNESWVIQPPKMVMRKAREPYDTHPHILTNWLLCKFPQMWTRINKTQRMVGRCNVVDPLLFDMSLCLCSLHSIMFAKDTEIYGVFSNVPKELLQYLLESLAIEYLLSSYFVFTLGQ